MMRDLLRARPRGRAWPLFLFLVLLVAAAVGWREGWIERWNERWHLVRPNSLPWEVPDLRQSPGLFAHLQIARLRGDRDSCLAALGEAGVKYTPIPDRVVGDRCGYTNAVRAEGMPIAFNYGLTASCSLTAALAWYEHDIDAIAERTLGARVARIEQLGTFACRNVNSEADGQRSEHATAGAIDIAAYVLSNGRRVTVARDWARPTAEGRFLAEAHAAACQVFSGVLGPDYNRLHANHFHLDLGRYRICR